MAGAGWVLDRYSLLVHEYGDGDSSFVAASVFYSTLFSALTVTVVLTLLKAAS